MTATRITTTDLSLIQDDCVFYSNNICYYGEILDNNATTIFNIYYIDIEHKTSSLIYQREQSYSASRTGIYFMKNDNVILYRRYYPSS